MAPTPDEHRPSVVRRTIGGALDATVGRVGDRVGDAARGVTETTAKQIIEDLEPYLIAETVPRIVDGVTPYLIETIVPNVVDGVTTHIAEVTVPSVLAGATPALADELLPRILEELQPYLEQQLVPEIVDGLVPHLNETVAPQLVDALMPKIRNEVVPQILDDIVDDPRVRDLIREQSQGMFLDALERIRTMMASADDVVENIVRRIAFRKPRPLPGPTDPPALPSRRYVNAGAFSRGVALAIDFGVIGFLVSVGLSTIIGLLQNIVNPLPHWLSGLLSFIALCIFPLYLAISWMLTGATFAEGVIGLRNCRDDGTRMKPMRALTKAWVEVLMLPIWIGGMILSPFARARKGALDILTGTQVRYFIHGESIEEPRLTLRPGENDVWSWTP